MVDKATGGAIEVQVFPSAQLGGEREVAEGMLIGSVQGQVPDVGRPRAVDARGPALRASLPVPRRPARAERNGEPLADEMAEKFTLEGIPRARLSARRHPPSDGQIPHHGPADVKGKKMRTIQSPLHITLWQTLGAIPTPLPPGEIYGGMQTGVIDFFDNAKSSYWDMKWYAVPTVTGLRFSRQVPGPGSPDETPRGGRWSCVCPES